MNTKSNTQNARERARKKYAGFEDDVKTRSAKSGRSDGKKPRWTPAKLWIPGDHYDLTAAFGVEPSLKPHGQGALSEQFWSRLYAEQNYIIYEPVECEFYRYNSANGAWSVTDPELIRREIIEGIEAAADLWRMGDLKKQCTERTLKGVLALLKGQIHAGDFFAGRPRHAIHAANCMIVFDGDGSHHEEKFAPEFRSRNASPIRFKRGAKCERFEKAMLGHLAVDTQELLQQYAGQILLGYNHSQTILLLIGGENSSKTAHLRLFAGLIGRHNACELRTRFLAERFEIGRYAGKTLLCGADVPYNFLSTEGADALKKLVGDDILTGESKRSNRLIDMEGRFNVAVSSNCKLLVKLHDDEGAWERRLAAADFPNPYKGDRVQEIHEVLLKAEGSGILNWALEGAEKLIAQGGQITLSDRQQNLVDDLIKESNSLPIFIRSKLVKTTDADDDLTTEELYAGYIEFCTDHQWGVPSVFVFQKDVPPLMLRIWNVPKVHNIERPSRKALNGYNFVRFRTDADADPF
jgi:hypothetical protein